MNPHHPPPNPHRSPGMRRTYFNRKSNGSKGESVSEAEPRAKTTSRRTGTFATLSNLLRGQGSSAPAARRLAPALIAALLGSIRRAFATHGAFASSDGTSARSHRPAAPAEQAHLLASVGLRRRRPRRLAMSLALAAVLAAALVFGVSLASAAPPTLSIDPVTTSATTTAHLSGEVSVPADGNETFWCFEYAEEGVGNWSSFCFQGPLQPGEALPVQTDLTALKAATKYEVRLAALNFSDFVEEFSSIEKFETDPAPVAPVATVDPATSVAYTTAQIQGAVDPEGGNEESSGAYVPIHWALQLSLSGDPGTFNDAASGDLTGADAESADPIDVPALPAELTGLSPAHTYTYRLFVTYAGQTVESSTATFTTEAVAKPTGSIEPVTTFTGTAATFTGHVNPNSPEPEPSTSPAEKAAFQTSWQFQCSPGCPGLEGIVAADNSSHLVEAQATGLQPGTPYEVSLIAANAGGQEAAGPVSFATPAIAPAVVSTFTTEVSATGATLGARIVPGGAATTYHFEYVTEQQFLSDGETFGAGTASTPESASIGSDNSEHPVSAQIQNLLPETTYHYRVVVTNSAGTVPGDPATFTTQGPAASLLPDARAWEQVSPPNKHGGLIRPINVGVIEAASNGSAITYDTTGPIVPEPSGNEFQDSQVISSRTAAGWVSEDISPPHEEITGAGGNGGQYRVFSDTLDTALVEPRGEMPLSLAASEKTIYVRRNLICNAEPAACYQPVVTGAEGYTNVPPGTVFGFTIHPITATPDMAHVVFASEVSLDPKYPTGGGIYVWSGGSPELISVLPDGTPAPSPEFGWESRFVRNAISADGSRVIWTGRTTSEGVEIPHLFLRDLHAQQTIQLDTVAGESGVGTPHFQLASADGARIFFTDGARLTSDSTAGGESAPDLYECEIVEVAGTLSCSLRDLTVDSNAGEAAGVEGVVIGASEDGSSVYFVANGRLAPGAVVGHCGIPGEVPAEAACNLYRWHEGTTSLVAVLGEDAADWVAESGQNLGTVSSRVSPNGRYLAFMSERPLTGYDNTDAISGQPDEEVFLYDGGANRLICASCNPSGARPMGSFDPGSPVPAPLFDQRRVWSNHWLAASIPGWTSVDPGHALYQSRYLSDNGRLFFNSMDSLVPADINAAADVYEYEPNGTGTCESTNGCVALISGGQSQENAAFLDASTDGSDVFFLTTAALVSKDEDSAFDVYDARECKVADECPPEAAAAPPPCRSAESCRLTAGQSVVSVPPASMALAGSGNIVLTPAQKLARALAACGKQRTKHKRELCRRRARRRYAKKNSRGPTLPQGVTSRPAIQKGSN